MSNINFDEITDGCVNGNGIFDEMMRSVKAHLQEEYDNQRIRGAEYSQVYIASINAAMQQSIQWHLGAETAKNQALLIEQQIEGQKLQNDLIEEQIKQMQAQTALIEAQTANEIAQGGLIPVQKELLEAQVEGALLSNQLVTQQTLTEEKNTATATYNLEQMLPAQKAVMDQKLFTEEAQTKDSTIQGNIQGVIGAQKDLYRKQIDGYDRDAEQKAVRTLTDTYGVAVSSDVETIPDAVSNQSVSDAIVALTNKSGLFSN